MPLKKETAATIEHFCFRLDGNDKINEIVHMQTEVQTPLSLNELSDEMRAQIDQLLQNSSRDRQQGIAEILQLREMSRSTDMITSTSLKAIPQRTKADSNQWNRFLVEYVSLLAPLNAKPKS